MLIQTLKINGFRGITELEIEKLGRVNLIVGKNNAFKTTLLEAIFLLTGNSNPGAIQNIHVLRDLFLTEPNDLNFIFHKLNFDNELAIQGNYDDGSLRTLSISPVKGSSFTDQGTTNGGGVDFSSSSPQYFIDKLEFSSTIKTSDGVEHHGVGSLQIIKGKIAVIASEKIREIQKGIFVPTNILEFVHKRWENILVRKQDQAIIDVLKTMEPKLSKIVLGTNNMMYADIDLDNLIPINLMGDGIKRLLTILIAMQEVRGGGVVMIDEIDNGLHFSAMENLWKVVLKMARALDVQVFATTHNVEVFKFLDQVLKMKEWEPYQSDVRNITLNRLPNSEIKAYVYDYEQLSFALQNEIEIR